MINQRNIFKLKYIVNIKEVKMFGDKRGLSTIVVTLIIILISLVAVGIVWVVVRNVIQGGTKTIESNANCITVDVEATSVNCSSAGVSRICDVTLQRSGTGTDAIGGVKLVFKNATAGTSSGLISVAGDIQPLLTKTQTGINTTISNVDTVEVTAFFRDASGNDQICAQTNPFKFI